MIALSALLPLVALGGPPPQLSVHTPAPLLVDAPAGHAPWARGRDYKAGFTTDGVSFVPDLGPRAPRNLPVRFVFREVFVGDRPVALDPRAVATVDGDTACYERGGVRELYRLGASSIEQVFVFDTLPAAGELRIRIEVESELPSVASEGGVRFGSASAGVRYGRATAIDAGGRATSAPVELVGDIIEIRVPASFLAQAALPLTVDPLITTLTIDESAFDDREPVVAYDASLDLYAVVWRRVFSAGDTDVHGVLLDGAGDVVREFALDVTPQDAREVELAGLEVFDQFLVARRFGDTGKVDVRTLTVDLGSGDLVTGAPSQVFLYAEDIELGGDPTPDGPQQYCLVAGINFGGARGVSAAMIGPDGEPDATAGFSEPDPFEPRVSPALGGAPDGPRGWGLFYGEGVSDPDGLRYRLVYPGPAFGPVRYVAGGSPVDAISVSSARDTATGEDGHVLVWKVAGPTGLDELRAQFRRNAPGAYSSLRIYTDPSAEQEWGSIDSDGSSFTICYTERLAPGGPTSVHAATYVVRNDALVQTGAQLLAAADELHAAPNLRSQHSGGGPPGRFLAVWQTGDAPEGDVGGAFYEAPSPGVRYCVGAPNSVGPGAVLEAFGSLSIERDAFGLAVSGCPVNQTGIFYLGSNGIQLPFGEGFRCVGGATRRVVPTQVIDGAGTATLLLDFDLPYGELVLPGAPGIRYQFWYRDPAGGPSNFNLSDALHVEHTP